MASHWSIQLLGALRASQDARSISRFRTHKTGLLLAYLALHCDRSHSREQIIELFWPDVPLQAGRNQLSMALSFLRHPLEPPGVPAGAVLIADRTSVLLNPEAITTDVTDFEAALRRASTLGDDPERLVALASAASLYTGELLPGHYEDWVLSERRRLGEAYGQALRQLMRLYEHSRDLARALETAGLAVRHDPFSEEAATDLIRLYHTNGQAMLARRTSQAFEQVLAQELAGSPFEALRTLAGNLARAGKGADNESDRDKALRSNTLPRPKAHSPASCVQAGPPTGTVALLLTDSEGSTAQWQEGGSVYASAWALHHMLLRQQFRRHGGHEVKETGDGFVVAFHRPSEALACAVGAQRALAEQPWPSNSGPVRVRMALHVGEIEVEEGDTWGLTLHHASSLLGAAHSEQILCSEPTAVLLCADLETEVWLEELGLYRLPDLPAPQRLFQVSYVGMARRDFGAPRADRAHLAILPLQFTRFIGREAEIGQLRRLLLPDVKPESAAGLTSGRLLTLTGPGGVGKTRLALAAAGQLLEPLSGAVFFAGLAEVREAARLADALVDALKLARSLQQDPLDQVIGFLKRQACLLVLDNFEQLLGENTCAWESVRVVSTLLEQIPALTVLVTSRQRLGLAGEREFGVIPLQVPPCDHAGEALKPERVSGIESVALFVDRAQIARPDFQLTARNVEAVAKLCTGLEGIPLAIELAAARARVLTASQMLGQLQERFKFLVGGGRVTLERHRTLEAAIDWSYRLLTPELQRFFVQLSVFRGGWTLEAAIAVCEEELALDYLSQLRDSSLILAEEKSETIQFRMLETLREFAHDRLVESAGERAARARHSEYYRDYVASGDPRQMQWGKEWREWLVQEEDNLLAAIEWRQEEPEYVLSLLLALLDLLRGNWRNRCRLKAGWEQALRIIVTSEIAKTNVSVRPVLRLAADHAAKTGDFAAADEHYDQMISLGGQTGDRLTTAIGLHGRGAVQWFRSDYAGAESRFQQALQIAEHLQDSNLAAACCLGLGSVAMRGGDSAAAEAYLQRALRVPGNEDGGMVEANVLNELGNLRLHEANYPSAQTYFEQALRAFQAYDDLHGQALSLNGMGMVAARTGQLDTGYELLMRARVLHHDAGDLMEEAISLAELGRIGVLRGHAEAQATLREALEIRARLGQVRETLETLEAHASLAGQERDWERCVALLMATSALRETLQLTPHRHMEIDRDGMLGRSRAALDAMTFQRALDAGALMDLQTAVGYALQHRAKRT